PTGPAVTVVATPDSVVPAVMAGVPMADSIRARAIDAQGRGVSGAPVTWGTAASSGAVSFLSNVADAGGRVGGMWVPSTSAGLDTAFVGLGAPSGRFYVTVLPGFAAVENLALVGSLTQGPISADSNSASFTSTGRHGVFVTHARDAFGNVATPSCTKSPQCFYFDSLPGAGFSHGYGTIDSVKADSVFFTVTNGFPTTFQIHATYPAVAAAIEDSVILNVNPVGVAVQIWGFGFGPADSVTYNSICPSTGPFNFFCQKNVYAYVVDSAGAPLQSNPGYFPQWQPLVPGDTTVGIDPNFQFSFATPVTAQMNGATAIVVSVTSSGPPPLSTASDTLYITVQQAPGQIAVTPGNRSLGLGDTTVFHGIVTDSGGAPVGIQPAIHWMAPSPSGIGEFAGVVKLDSAADSLVVRLDSGFYNISNFDWQAVVRAFLEIAPGDTISGQGVLVNPIVYDQFSITANGQGHAAVDTGAHRMFVVNGGFLEGLNIDNDAPVGSIGIGSSGSWIAVDQDSNRVFVSDQFANSVNVVDALTFTPRPAVSLPGSPVGLALSPADHRLYAAMRSCTGGPPCVPTSFIVPIDAGADTMMTADTARLAIDSLVIPEGLAFNPATGLLYISSNTGLVYVYDPATKVLVDSIVANAGSLLQGMAFNPVNGMLYVADWSGGQVLKIDPASKAVTPVGSVNNPYDVGIDPVHNKIYASASSNTLLVQINGATDTYQWLLAGTSNLDEPGNVAVDPRTGVVFVPHPNSLTIYQFYGHSFPAPLTAPRRQVAGAQPTPRSFTPRIPAGLLPRGGSRRPPPARKPGATLPGILPGAQGGKKSPK
ncbi:MAG TPA: YncE family protein, partial [Gemmatimonadales bacterium]